MTCAARKMLMTVAVLGALRPSTARAIADEFDVAVKTGVQGGIVRRPDPETGSERKATLGGVPLIVAFNYDLIERISGVAQAEITFDVLNSQISREGVAGGISYHVLGGGRTVSTRKGDMQLESSTPYNVSVIGRGGIYNYMAASKDATSKLSGSAFEFMAGGEYRQEVMANAAVCAEILATAFALPASTERLTPRFYQLILGWRGRF